MQDRRDRFAREALVHLPELLRVGIRLAGDHAAGEDLVQETFLQGWRSFDRYRPGTNCRAWLYRILFLVLAERRRRDARMPALTPFDEHAGDLEASSAAYTTPEFLHVDDVRAAFARLPESFRVVVMLADVEEHSYREIAEELGIPVGTVMSRLSRGRRMLREELSRRGRHAWRVIRNT